MRRFGALSVFAVALTSSAAFGPTISHAAIGSCASLAAAKFPNTTITTAVAVPAGTFNAPDGEVVQGLPQFCRVHGVVRPVPGSNIGFELWMPANGWNQKLEMFGNGGYSSFFSYATLGSLMQRGYATLATDTGHTGDDPEPFVDGATDPQIIVDWGHRAVHESVATAKLVIRAFYKSEARHAYFNGCSTGGHQALMEAQRYPDDFDGIIAGDPGNNRTHLNAGFLWQFIQNHPRHDNAVADMIITKDKLSLITNAVVAQCHGHDGGLATDNFLTDPRACHFDAASLLCKAGQDASTCLSQQQVDTLKRMYGGARDLRNGHDIYPGWPVGSEANGWNTYWDNPAVPTEPARGNFWRFWVFNNAKWDWWTFDWDADMKFTDDKLAPILNAMNPDLRPFAQNGGKLIQYHGFADPVVAPADSIDYWERVVASDREGRDNDERDHDRHDMDNNVHDTDRDVHDTNLFYRLFMVPGMSHCQGGQGANVFDTQTALEQWVEFGVAPETIVATKYLNNNPAQGVAFTRPLCVYPKLPRYNTGDPTSAASFTCVRGEHEPTQMPAPEYLR
jgi:feruloyl esterase